MSTPAPRPPEPRSQPWRRWWLAAVVVPFVALYALWWGTQVATARQAPPPALSALGNPPAGTMFVDRGVRCAPDGCWREFGLNGVFTATKDAQRVLAPEEVCSARNLLQPRRVCRAGGTLYHR